MSVPKKSIVHASPFSPQQLDSLRRAAKVSARARGIPHSRALDEIAAQHGYRNWSLLARAANRVSKNAVPISARPSVDDMVEWFQSNHTLAVEESPWDSSEGGYLYPTLDGAPDIAEILSDQFPNAGEADVEQAANQLDDGEPWLAPNFMRLLNEDAADEAAALSSKDGNLKQLSIDVPRPVDPDLAHKL